MCVRIKPLGLATLLAVVHLAMPAGGQSSEGRGSSSQSIYRAVKKAVAESISPDFSMLRRAQEEGNYDLESCRGASDLGMRSTTLAFPTYVAIQVEIYVRDFEELRVPHEIFDRDLADMDQFAVAVLEEARNRPGSDEQNWERWREQFRPLQERLLRDLESYRRRTGSQLPRFVIEGGCGAGEVEVEITTTPRGGIVSFIPLFSYKLCEARGIDPTDQRRCEGWQQAVKIEEDMIGRYFYVAVWPGGRQRQGQFSIKGKTQINIAQ